MLKDKIAVIGGYGNVGRIISIELGNKFPGKVICAGRNYNKAEQLSKETQQKVLPMQLDVSKENIDMSLLNDVSLVVMCIDQGNTNFVKTVLSKGINYIDITASYDFLSQIEELDEYAKQTNTTAVLSVGLSPGLTNIFAKHCKAKFDKLHSIDIFVMLGMGDRHGEAVLIWWLKKLNEKYSILQNGKEKIVKNLDPGKKTVFPDKIGKRKAYYFNYADQHAIAKTLNIDSAATFNLVDSKLMTWSLAFLQKIGYFKLQKFKIFNKLTLSLLKRMHFGSDKYIIKVDAKGEINNQVSSYECFVKGYGEGTGTGIAAAKTAEEIYNAKELPKGVFHLDQLFEPVNFINKLNKLEKSGLVIHY
ncbi:saccharopine dehydrogenase family protein [bacterium]